jgi:hypothetical protein
MGGNFIFVIPKANKKILLWRSVAEALKRKRQGLGGHPPVVDKESSLKILK